MAGAGVVLIILGCAVYQYLKGSLFKAFVTIIVTICSIVVAFWFFEILADVFVSRSEDSRFISVVPWAQLLSFALLFIISFAILRTGAELLIHQTVDLGLWPERIGRVVCGLFLGLLLSGVLLTALAMAPIPKKYPYQRFDVKRHKVLLNADGLATGLFSLISRGSFSGKKSFAALHPDYLDQLYLNRLLIADDIPLITSSPAIVVPTKKAAWPAPDSLKQQIDNLVLGLNRRGKLVDESTGESIVMPAMLTSDYDPMIVRVGIKKSAIKTSALINGGIFTLPQLRLICKRKGPGEDPLAGKGKNIYPLGHLKAADRIQVSRKIKIERSDFDRNAREKWIDFVFCVPNGYVPVFVEYKLNSIAQIRRSAIVSADQAPPVIPFSQVPEKKKGSS